MIYLCRFFLFVLLWGVLCTSASARQSAAPEYAEKAFLAKNYEEAMRLYAPLAEHGQAQAQLRMGQMFEGGLGVSSDIPTAGQWYLKAAQQGHAGAQTNLGYLYERGLGVRENPATAASWYAKAAEQGYARAQNNLGVLYLKGKGVPRDLPKAKHWFKLAAQQGLAQAKETLDKLSGNTAQDKANPVGLPSSAAFRDQYREQPNALTLPIASQEIRLFGIALVHARRDSMSKAVETWTVAKLSSDKDNCDKYAAEKILESAGSLEICYDGDGYVGTLTYHFPVSQEQTKENLLKVVQVKKMVAGRHGEPAIVKGYRDKGPVYYGWDINSVRIGVSRQWPEISVSLQYSVIVKEGTIRRGQGETF